MRTTHISLFTRFARASRKGFILPFTMLISTLILLVSGSALTLLTKQLYFSKIYKQSQTAYYAADDAIMCAIDIDDTYVNADGLGIFPYSTTTDAMTYINGTLTYVNNKRIADGLSSLVLNDISCAQSKVFTGTSNFTIATTTYRHTFSGNRIEEGKTVSYMMRMDLGLDPNDPAHTAHLYRCAKITVSKTESFRQIISQGYAQCDNPNGTVERAVVNTTEAE